MTRDEHVAWVKERALGELDAGGPTATINALASVRSDMRKHHEVREFIEGIRCPMKTFFFEATHGDNSGNWGRFLVGVLDTEWEWTSQVDPGRGFGLATRIGPDQVWVLDLVTREGAAFSPHGFAAADLDKHRVWVCPMFEPFLAWLYTKLDGKRHGDQIAAVLAGLPQVVELPDAPFAMAAPRRPGDGL